MKNIRIYAAPKYKKSKYTPVEENIWMREGEGVTSGVLTGINDEVLADDLRSRSGWEPAPEPWDDMLYLSVDGKSYFREISIDEDSPDDIYTEEMDAPTYVTSLMFEQEPEYGENLPDDPEVSQYPLEDLLDRFYCSVSDFYKRKNKSDSVNSYLEFESEDILDIRALLTIIGKHVYNKEDDDGIELIIE